jgi:hypothetical protein
MVAESCRWHMRRLCADGYQKPMRRDVNSSFGIRKYCFTSIPNHRRYTQCLNLRCLLSLA